MITTQVFDSSRQALLCGTTQGFFVYDTIKNKRRIAREFAGGIRIIKTINKTNIFALTLETSPNFITIWDDYKKEKVCNLKHKFDIVNIIITKEYLIAILPRKIHIYSLREFKLLHKIKTGYNPKGICALANCHDRTLVIFPSSLVGNIVFYNIGNGQLLEELSAHKAEIACIAVSDDPDQSLLFTASVKGTIIRGFSIEGLEKLYEFRRGLSSSKIYSMCTDFNATSLAVASNSGSTHIFSLEAGKKNTESVLSFAKSILPNYYSSKWSHTTICNNNVHQAVVAFRTIDSILFLMITYQNGDYYKYRFDQTEGSLDLVKHHNLSLIG